jgi:hypothetical protein
MEQIILGVSGDGIEIILTKGDGDDETPLSMEFRVISGRSRVTTESFSYCDPMNGGSSTNRLKMWRVSDETLEKLGLALIRLSQKG